MPRLRQLEGASQALVIVRVDDLRRRASSPASRACAAAASLAHLVADPLARRSARGGWHVEIRQGRAEVKPGAAHDDSGSPPADEVVDLHVGERGEGTDAHVLVEVADGDEPGPLLRLVREDREAAVDLHRVGRHDLACRARPRAAWRARSSRSQSGRRPRPPRPCAPGQRRASSVVSASAALFSAGSRATGLLPTLRA